MTLIVNRFHRDAADVQCIAGGDYYFDVNDKSRWPIATEKVLFHVYLPMHWSALWRQCRVIYRSPSLRLTTNYLGLSTWVFELSDNAGYCWLTHEFSSFWILYPTIHFLVLLRNLQIVKKAIDWRVARVRSTRNEMNEWNDGQMMKLSTLLIWRNN